MEFNLKNLEPSDPIELYNRLEKLVRFGDLHATVRGEKDDVEGYFLGGLLVNDIKKSSVSSETINKLYSALKSYELNHAILPEDIYKGQIPLVLDDQTRSYLRKNLEELIEYENLSWRIFFIPMKIDVDDEELMHAEIVFEQDTESEDNYHYVSIHYSRIEAYLNELVSDNEITYDTSFIKKSINDDSDANEEPTDEPETSKEVSRKKENDDTLDQFNFDDDASEEETVKEANQSQDNDETENISDDNESLSKEPEVSKDDDEPLIEDNKDDETIESDIDIQDLDVASEFTEIPPELQATLNDFYLGRFNEFENVDPNDTTHVILQKEIRNANNVIQVKENDFKRKAKQIYMQYMSESYNEINKAIDVENGDDVVKNKHLEMQDRKKELDVELQKRIEQQKQELVHDFWNRHFETFKEQTLAGLKLKFEKEEYYNLVAEPLERYEEAERNRNEDAKFEITHEQSNWLDSIKTDAITKDRNNAIMEVQNYLEGSKQQVQNEIKELDTKMTELNERYIQYEYSKKAEERLRNTVGSDLYTDEQAKKYKKQYEMTEKEKESAISELQSLKSQYKKDMETKTKEHNDFKKEIETSHQSVLKSKEDKLSSLNEKLTNVQSENEKNKAKLDNSNKKKKKQLYGTGIGAFLISTVIFGGAALGIHSQNENAQEKLDAKDKVVQQQKDEASKNKEELEKIKKDKEEESKKQQKIIDDQKKELEKQKKKKDKK